MRSGTTAADRWTIAALGAAALLTPMAAHAVDRECRPQLALGTSLELWRVAGRRPIPFIAGGEAGADCPGPGPVCTLSGQAPPNAPVVVTGRAGPYACAAFVGPAPALHVARGWLPLAGLARVVRGKSIRWVGEWRAEAAQSIAIRARRRSSLSVYGIASWGADDPARVAAGQVNSGELIARGSPRGDRLDLADGDCTARMWRLGPYLVVADNGRCGGMNVSFTGVYRSGR